MPTNKIIYGPGRIPQASEFAVGEIIINLDDAKVYSKDKQNNVFEIAGSVGAPDGFKFAYLSSLFESGSIEGPTTFGNIGESEIITTDPNSLASSYSLDPTQMLDLRTLISIGDIIKVVSSSQSSFHEITDIDGDKGHSASISPTYTGGNVGSDTTYTSDTDIIKMTRNESGSLFVTSSTSNRNIIFSGSTGVKITTGSEPQSIEISIDGTAVSAQSDNIIGALFTLNDTSGQTGINFTPDGAIESGDTITAVASGLGSSANVQFGNLTIGNITSDGVLTFSGLDNVSTENHVLVFNDGNNEIDYIPTSSIIPVLQSQITAKINPYAPGADEEQKRVGGVDNNQVIPVGTSIEQVLRDILIDVIESNITQVRGELNASEVISGDALSSTNLGFSGGNYREVGHNDTNVNDIKIVQTQDSDEEFFGQNTIYTVTLSGNDTNNGAIAPLSGFGTTTRRLYFGSTSPYTEITLNRETPGRVTFTVTAEDPDIGYTKTGTVSGEFAYPIFCGRSHNSTAYQNSSLFDTMVMRHISGSHSTTGIGTTNSVSVNGEIQTLISHKHGVRVNEEPSSTQFPDIGTNSVLRGIKVKISDEIAPQPAGTNSLVYIVYPSSYGDLTKIEISGFQSISSDGQLSDFYGPFVRNHTRFGVDTEYNMYVSKTPGAYPPSTEFTLFN